MVKNVTKLLDASKAGFSRLCEIERDVRGGADAEAQVPELTRIRTRMLEVIRQFRDWSDREYTDYRGLCCDIDAIHDYVKMDVSDARRKVREARIHADRAVVDTLRPASAHIDRPIRGRHRYPSVPRPGHRPDPSVIADGRTLTLDQALHIVRTMVETLDDATAFPSSFLNWPYRSAIEKGVPRINTVADLRPLSHDALVGLPQGSRRLILNQLCKVARENGLDVDFAGDPATVLPTAPADRVLHALSRGLVLAYVQHESYAGRVQNCHRVYEVVDGMLTENDNTAPYNETDGAIAGYGKYLKCPGLTSGGTIDGKHVRVISDEGRALAATRFARAA